MQYNIRSANLADAKEIARIHVDVWREHYHGVIPDSILDGLEYDKREKSWISIINKKNERSDTFVLEHSSRIYGFCHVGPSRDADAKNDTGELYTIYLLSEMRGGGLGHALMSRGLEFLKAAEYKRCTLWVLTTNVLAKKFYERYGWQDDKARKEEKSGGFIFHESRYIIDL